MHNLKIFNDYTLNFILIFFMMNAIQLSCPIHLPLNDFPPFVDNDNILKQCMYLVWGQRFCYVTFVIVHFASGVTHNPDNNFIKSNRLMIVWIR